MADTDKLTVLYTNAKGFDNKREDLTRFLNKISQQ